jgi:peptidyl-prolyl cis-trans isomerase B (cyclophilin B)
MTDLQQPQDLSDEQLTDVLVELEVSVGGQPAGTMQLEFWPQVAPATVRNFTRYVAEGFYDGKIFHRVISGFMIQGGCPTGTGTGSGPHGHIPGEFTGDAQYSHKRGVLSMARAQDPNSASCQFFVCHADAEFLDGQYAAFGRLVSGEDALDAVAGVQTGGQDRPAQECKIESAKLISRI